MKKSINFINQPEELSEINMDIIKGGYNNSDAPTCTASGTQYVCTASGTLKAGISAQDKMIGIC